MFTPPGRDGGEIANAVQSYDQDGVISKQRDSGPYKINLFQLEMLISYYRAWTTLMRCETYARCRSVP